MKMDEKLLNASCNEDSMLQPPLAEPINPQDGMLDPCLRGMKLIENDKNLCDLLKRIYTSEIKS